jgi:hypothetical protein
MSDSILNSTKKVLGLAEDYTEFDIDILMHINSALSTLTQLGVGPILGFNIEDAAATWTEFLGGDPRYNSAKSYVYLRVRRLFDPPQTSFHLTALNEQIQELEWRLNVQHELDTWIPIEPTPTGGLALDGGSAYGG